MTFFSLLTLSYLHHSFLIHQNFYHFNPSNSVSNSRGRQFEEKKGINCSPVHVHLSLAMSLFLCWIMSDDRTAFAGNVGEVAVHKRWVPTLCSLFGRYSNAGDRIHLPAQHFIYIFTDYVDQFFSGLVFNSSIHAFVFLEELLDITCLTLIVYILLSAFHLHDIINI